jgi:site-specific recombinase XerC
VVLCKAIRATSMPKAATRLPYRAVFGELKNLMPMMNKTETPMKIRAMVELIFSFS